MIKKDSLLLFCWNSEENVKMGHGIGFETFQPRFKSSKNANTDFSELKFLEI